MWANRSIAFPFSQEDERPASTAVAVLEIDGEAQTGDSCARKLVLPHASGLAGGSDNAADLGRGAAASR
jgi:4-diphosphocytidyl-2C-methyl-D-erythritol kinase